MTTTTYDDFSQDYDRFVNWESRLAAEMPFLEHLLGQINTGHAQPLSVLDAACGTGMHAIALARKGYRAAGADYSQGMVAAAQVNADKLGMQVLFKHAGFREIKRTFESEANFPFDAITCFGNSLPHLTSREAIKQALLDFSDCLRPGGRLVLQNRNFDAVMAKRERWIGPQAYSENGSDWLFLRFYDFDADGLISFNIVRLKREAGGEWTQALSTVRLYPLLKEELLELMDETGFIKAALYGMMKDIPFDAMTSENLVTVAYKK
jgi:SAM-dependent methyltransferase